MIAKWGPTIPVPPGHDLNVEVHSSIWPDDCHCQGFHWFCTHTLAEAIAEALGEEE